MTITLELTPDERETLLVALRRSRLRAMDDCDDREIEAIHALTRKVAETPCGNPGCSYCDPQADDWQDWPADDWQSEYVRRLTREREAKS